MRCRCSTRVYYTKKAITVTLPPSYHTSLWERLDHLMWLDTLSRSWFTIHVYGNLTTSTIAIHSYPAIKSSTSLKCKEPGGLRLRASAGYFRILLKWVIAHGLCASRSVAWFDTGLCCNQKVKVPGSDSCLLCLNWSMTCWYWICKVFSSSHVAYIRYFFLYWITECRLSPFL